MSMIEQSIDIRDIRDVVVGDRILVQDWFSEWKNRPNRQRIQSNSTKNGSVSP